MKAIFILDWQWLKSIKSMLWIMIGFTLLYCFIMPSLAIIFAPMMIAMTLSKSIGDNLHKTIGPYFFTLPFTRKQYVQEKYMISIIPALLLILLVAIILSFSTPFPMLVIQCANSFFGIILMVSILIPLSIKYRDNGLLLFRVISIAIVISLASIAEPLVSLVGMQSSIYIYLPLILGIASIVIILISITISNRLIQKCEL